MKPYSLIQETMTATAHVSVELPSARAVGEASSGGPAEHLGDLALAFRDEFKLGGLIAETDILASLQLIARQPEASERWLALFNSPLGAALRSGNRDLNTAMGFVLSQLPKTPS